MEVKSRKAQWRVQQTEMQRARAMPHEMRATVVGESLPNLEGEGGEK